MELKTKNNKKKNLFHNRTIREHPCICCGENHRENCAVLLCGDDYRYLSIEGLQAFWVSKGVADNSHIQRFCFCRLQEECYSIECCCMNRTFSCQYFQFCEVLVLPLCGFFNVSIGSNRASFHYIIQAQRGDIKQTHSYRLIPRRESSCPPWPLQHWIWWSVSQRLVLIRLWTTGVAFLLWFDIVVTYS